MVAEKKGMIGFKEGDFPNSEVYYQSTLTLPLFSSMSSEQQDKVVTILGKIFYNFLSPALECIGAVQRGREKEHKSR